MSLETPLTELLGIRQPVLLAPMAGIAGGALAAAVSRAGGLGIIGGGYGDRDWLADQLARCDGVPFGIGFITWSLARQPALLDQALDAKPRVVFLSFGSLEPFASRARDAGSVVVAQVQTVRQARQAVGQGAQVVVAQGNEAGGHGGLRGTIALVPAIVDAVGPVPVVAAGGIADGRGLAAALMLGAAGVLCGTAFYAAAESLAHPAARQRLVEASGDDTSKGPMFDTIRGFDWPAGPWALRTLRNRLSARWAGDLDGLDRSIEAVRSEYRRAQEAGDFDTAAVIAGEAADLVREVRPAAAIVAAIVSDAERLVGRGPRAGVR